MRRRRNGDGEGVGEESREKEPPTRTESRLYCGNNDESRAREEEHPHTTKYLLSKWVILRLLGMVYFVAFLGAWYQNQGLMGKNGLQPAADYVNRLYELHSSKVDGFLNHPTLFWWIPLNDTSMDAFAAIGCILSSLVVIGFDSWLVMFLLWIIDFSIVTITEGTSFYSYGWESQLLETGFLAIFLCELPHIVRVENKQWRIRALWKDSAESTREPSTIVLWLFRWLCFRISIGAGLIKVRGSTCWAEKTCLYYHFETQPIPSPMSFVFHFLPKWALTRAVDLDLWVQLYTSWFVLVPICLPGTNSSVTFHPSRALRNILRVGGFVQAGFMINIMLSGNFAFLNHLTVIPALACLDDECWPSFLVQWLTQRDATKPITATTSSREKRASSSGYTIPPRFLVDVLLAVLIGTLSSPVVANLLQLGGGRQVMNASFSRFRLVNTYGAFGSVGEARYEPIVSVSRDGLTWQEIEFPCKPGDVGRTPCFCAPYHYRLDWNIWFIGFKPHKMYLQQRERWMFALLRKLLDEKTDRPWLHLLDSSTSSRLQEAYKSKRGPKYAKVDMYHYKMSRPLWEIVGRWLSGNSVVVWWERRFEESLVPPVQLDPQHGLVLAPITKLREG